MSDAIRAITLWQPWASLIALGLKNYETRSWSTPHRGKLLIHAAKRPVEDFYVWEKARELSGLIPSEASKLPKGAIVAIADLTACLKMVEDLSSVAEINIRSQSQTELICGDWRPGRYAWKLENVRAIDPPIPAKGAQGLWVPPLELLSQIQI